MADTALDVLKGAIARMKGFTGLTDIVGQRIYNNVPQNEQFPYCVVTIESNDWSTKDFSGQDHTFRVQAFSKKPTSQQCLQIRKQVIDALDRQEANITLDNGNLVYCQKTGLQTAFREPDNIWQSVCEFSITVQP